MIRVSLKKIVPANRRRSKKRPGADGGKIARALESGTFGRWMLGVVVFIVSVLIISWRGMPLDVPVIGQISERDITATCDFTFPDRLKTEQARDAAENHQPVAYTVIPTVPVEKEELVKDFMIGISGDRSPPLVSPIELAMAQPSRVLSVFLRAVLIPEWEDRSLLLLENAYRNGILSPDIKRTLVNTRQERIMLVDHRVGKERMIPIPAIPTTSTARETVITAMEDLFPVASSYRAGLKKTISFLIEPDLEFDPEKTEALRASARRDIPVVMTEVRKGEKIIRQGDEVRATHIQKVRSYQEELYRRQPPISLVYYTIGIGLMVILLFLITLFFLERYHREVSRSNSRLLLISMVVVLILILARGLHQIFWHLPPGMMESARYISPVIIGSLLLTLLIGVRVAIFFTLILTFQTTLIMGGGADYIMVGVISAMAGVFGLSGARRRIDLLRAGVISSAAGFLAVAALGIAHGMEPLVFLSQGGGAAAAGILSAFVTLIALGLFETIFRVSSDIGLLELSDLNHPLLRRLMIRAPGTYHHCLMVATLAEGGAEEIGANSLLARIGSYFHDIGKIVKPEYFSENETSDSSRHDALIPSMSSLILITHVKEGVGLARQHKLDRRIVAIIEQHHGTSLISYFYDRAGRSRQLKFNVLEDDYRYPGPKPQSREAAIVMLADAAEAASVSLERPTPVRLENLIKNIFQERFSDGQLDECNLTLVNLKKIEESFVRLLSARYHTRVKYPEGNGGRNEEEIKESLKNR